jgi:photosystem II stability/assembly factor-like uncharacterized protein
VRLRLPSLVTVPLAATLTVTTAQAAPPTWVPTLTVGVQGADTITAFADGTVYELHTAGGIEGFYRSGDYGQTWQPLAAPPAGGFGNIGMASPKVGYAASDFGVISRTTDGATSWVTARPLPTKAGPEAGTTAVGVAKGTDTVMVAGTEYAPFHTGCNRPIATPIWSSHDGGRSWIRVDLGRDHGVFNIDVYDAQLAIARVYDVTQHADCSSIGDRNAIYVTRDGGRSWRRVLNCPVGHLCTASAFVSRSRLLVGRNEGTTVVSDDAGRTFKAGPSFVNALPKPQDSSQWYWVQSYAFADKRRGWVSVKGVGTYRTDDSGAHWELEHSQDEVWGVGIGDADAASYEHAVIAGPTFVSTRVSGSGPQRSRPAALGGGVSARTDRVSVDAAGVLRIAY